MALTAFQRDVCRVLAGRRLLSRDLDLFHDTSAAVARSWDSEDWVDVIACDERLQPMGYLAWAACGKAPGFSPLGVIEQARRSSHYSSDEVASLAFDGAPPDAGDLSRRWSRALAAADAVIARLPADHVGKAVLTREGQLFRGQPEDLDRGLATGHVVFHAGHLGGALPQITG